MTQWMANVQRQCTNVQGKKQVSFIYNIWFEFTQKTASTKENVATQETSTSVLHWLL